MLSEEDIQQLRRLMELREKKDELKAAAAKASEEYADAEAELFDKLDSGPMSRLNNVDLGEPWGRVSFGRRETYYGRVIKGMESEAAEYFREHGMGDIMAKPSFVKKRLNEIARDCREQGTSPPPGIDWYPNRGVTITVQKN